MSAERFQVREGSQSAHCCFDATVVDTTKPRNYADENGPTFEAVCECFDVADAEMIAKALNSGVA